MQIWVIGLWRFRQGKRNGMGWEGKERIPLYPLSIWYWTSLLLCHYGRRTQLQFYDLLFFGSKVNATKTPYHEGAARRARTKNGQMHTSSKRSPFARSIAKPHIPSSIPTFLHHGLSPVPFSLNISSASPTCLLSLISLLTLPLNLSFIAFVARKGL
jgi:hypothetical protein